MEPETNGLVKAADEEVIPLDDAAIEAIAELETQQRNAVIAENAILSYFLRQNKIEGNWQLRRSGPGALRELVKT